jgi:hypothetical protein
VLANVTRIDGDGSGGRLVGQVQLADQVRDRLVRCVEPGDLPAFTPVGQEHRPSQAVTEQAPRAIGRRTDPVRAGWHTEFDGRGSQPVEGGAVIARRQGRDGRILGRHDRR